MPKGQKPKHEGSIHIVTNDVSNDAYSNGDDKGNAKIKLLWQAMSILNQFPHRLKENNHLYSDIVINVGKILNSLLSLSEHLRLIMKSL